jgi:DNA (cytosine-5)-methyltransferase 1
MAEVRALPWNGFNAVSTFSGGGGSSTGYRMAGFRLLWANEFIDSARDTYRANMAPYTVLDGRDIRQVKASDILDSISMKPGQIDLFDGSPPCASFSTAGKRQAGWGKVKKYSDKAQRTDDLFFEFIRLLRDMKPKTFVAENVSGLVKGAAKGYFIEIMRELKASGYRVSCKVLDAQWLGVPQARQRTIFVGVREDLGLDPVHPRPLSYQYSVRDVHPHLIQEKRSGTKDNWQSTIRPASSIVASGGTVSPTAYLSGGSFYRTATETRRLTIEELKPLCGFPDDYILNGSYAQQWERCGRSVPPVMMSHIAAAIRDQILTKVSR